MKKNNIKKILIPIVALILVVCLGIAGVMAYLTARDTAVNEFTVGELSIDLQEPAWDALPDSDGDGIPDAAENLSALKEVDKDPQIYNDGNNDAYVFLEVIVPYRNVQTSNDNGTKNESADTQLFTWTVNEGWEQVGDMTDNEDGTYTYVYAWAADDEMTVLLPGDTTGTLFDKVIFANIVEGQIPGEELEIIINAYGIQASNINGGVTDPEGVWEVMMNVLTRITPDAPPAPVAEDITDTSVTLVAVDGCEYAVGSSVATYSRSFELEWQDSPVFTGLTPGTEYTFYMRYKETETANASEIVSVKISTIKSTVAAPDAPTVEEVTENSVTLTAVDGAEYSMDGITWQDSPTFTGLTPGAEYTFYVRYKETETVYASVSVTVSQELPNPLMSIAVTTAPQKTAYIVGQYFNPTGMEVTATYANNSTRTLSANEVDALHEDALEEGQTDITIAYSENDVTKNATVTVTAVADADLTNFTISSEYRTEVGYTGASNENLVIPEIFYDEEDDTWYRVTGIGDGAFSDCSGLLSIEIPSSITTISYNAFIGCSNLTIVNISDLEAWCKINFKSNASNPLMYARNLCLNGVLVEGTLVIPDGITSINDYAFIKCVGITSVIIPDGVTSIGTYAFAVCKNLTSITIPTSVNFIGTYAFQSSESLTDVYYTGDESSWNSINIRTGSPELTNATIHYNYTAE